MGTKPSKMASWQVAYCYRDRDTDTEYIGTLGHLSISVDKFSTFGHRDTDTETSPPLLLFWNCRVYTLPPKCKVYTVIKCLASHIVGIW